VQVFRGIAREFWKSELVQVNGRARSSLSMGVDGNTGAYVRASGKSARAGFHHLRIHVVLVYARPSRGSTRSGDASDVFRRHQPDIDWLMIYLLR
jgi:hypothetical protein